MAIISGKKVIKQKYFLLDTIIKPIQNYKLGELQIDNALIFSLIS